MALACLLLYQKYSSHNIYPTLQSVMEDFVFTNQICRNCRNVQHMPKPIL